MRVLARRLGRGSLIRRLFDIVDLEEIDGKDMPGAVSLWRLISRKGGFLLIGGHCSGVILVWV